LVCEDGRTEERIAGKRRRGGKNEWVKTEQNGVKSDQKMKEIKGKNTGDKGQKSVRFQKVKKEEKREKLK
jgi:hypothetical protein